MIRWFRQYLAISRNAMTVSLSDPVFLVLMLCVMALMAFFAALPSFAFGQELRLIRDQGLALVFLGGCIAGAMMVATVVVRDLRQGAISVLMSRPVSGLTVVAGKWTGLAAALFVYQVPATISCLWITRIVGVGDHGQGLDPVGLTIYFLALALALGLTGLKHYFFGGWYVWEASIAVVGGFALAFVVAGFLGSGPEGHWAEGVDWRAFNGCVLIFLAELIFAALLMPFAMRLDTAVVLGVAVVVFFLGMVSNSVVNLFLRPGLPYHAAKSILPNWQAFWISDWLAAKGDLDSGRIWRYIGSCSIHTLAYVIACLAIAAMLFNRREFHGHDTI